MRVGQSPCPSFGNRVLGSGQGRRRRSPPTFWETIMSKDKGGRAAKKPKADKNIKATGQTPATGSGAVSASAARGKK